MEINGKELNFKDIFLEGEYATRFDPQKVFVNLFDKIPHKIGFFIEGYKYKNKDLEIIKFLDEYTKDKIVCSKNYRYSDDEVSRNKIYVLSNEIIINIVSSIDPPEIYHSEESEYLNNLTKAIESNFFVKTSKNKIKLLSSSKNGLDMIGKEIDRKLEFNIESDYCDAVNANIDKILNNIKETKSGIHLFYGEPGTGKSSFIQFLIQNSEKDFVFIPNYVSDQLDSPSFINLLIENSNSVIIIEDAEKILQSRNKLGNSLISTILNLSDGILGNTLNLQFICTLNTDLSAIDSAVLRKGRMMNCIEFSKLSWEKSVALHEKLGHKNYGKYADTLANIYNYEEVEKKYTNEVKTIGFRHGNS